MIYTFGFALWRIWVHLWRRFIHYDSPDDRTLRARKSSLFYDAYHADIFSTDYCSEIGNGEKVEIAP